MLLELAIQKLGLPFGQGWNLTVNSTGEMIVCSTLPAFNAECLGV